VDTPNLSELIAANRSIESIREFIGADSLQYLSLDGLHAAVQDTVPSRFCSACYTGSYPTALVLESQIGRCRQ
jgi:amidophosphoribosyltransferase